MRGAPVGSVLDVPDDLGARDAVVVAKAGAPLWLAFDCPCRAGHRVMVNLDARSRPVWRVTSARPLTLVPSVDERTVYGRCHYIIRGGKVRWV